MSDKTSAESDLKRELELLRKRVAELSAAALCYLVGRRPERTLGNSYRYIKKYAEKADLSPHTACLRVLADVEKVLHVIIEGKMPDSSDYSEQR